MTPAWILDVLAALMLMVAAVSAARIAAARPWRRGGVAVDTDVAHVLMAIAMAGMLAPGLGALPDSAWEVIFCLLIAWFAAQVLADARSSDVRALAGGHCAPHLVHSGSMLYMFLDASSPAARASGMTSGMSGTSGGPESATMALGHPTLAFLFAFTLVGYAVWDLDRLSGRRYAAEARLPLGRTGALRVVGVPVLAGARPSPGSPSAATSCTAPIAAPNAGRTALAADERAVPPVGDGQAASDMDLSARGAPHADGAAAPASPCGAGPATAGPAPHGPGAGGGFLLSPAVTVGGRITMGVVMAFMLLIAL